jgi:hypothetical protein
MLDELQNMLFSVQSHLLSKPLSSLSAERNTRLPSAGQGDSQRSDHCLLLDNRLFVARLIPASARFGWD